MPIAPPGTIECHKDNSIGHSHGDFVRSFAKSSAKTGLRRPVPPRRIWSRSGAGWRRSGRLDTQSVGLRGTSRVVRSEPGTTRLAESTQRALHRPRGTRQKGPPARNTGPGIRDASYLRARPLRRSGTRSSGACDARVLGGQEVQGLLAEQGVPRS